MTEQINFTAASEMVVDGTRYAAGQRVQLALDPADVHDPTEMSQYLAGYTPFEYRADEVSPPILVDNDSDKYRTFDANDAFKRVPVKGSVQGAIPEVDPKSSLDNYNVVERYIGAFIPQQTQTQTGNNYRPVFAALRRCSRAIMLDRELDTFGLVNTPGNWAASAQHTAAAVWTDTTNGVPLTDLQTMIEKSSQPVTALWMNQHVGHVFIRHPQVRDTMRQFYGDDNVKQVANNILNAGISGRSLDVEVPGLPPIRISASKVLNETTGNYDYCFGNVVNAITRPPGVPTDGEDIASTYTFRRRGPSGNGFNTRDFFVPSRGPLGGTFVVVSMADVAKMTSTTAGGILSGVVA